MKFYRYVGGSAVPVDLTGLYGGKTVFLVGGSPTLLQQDYERLSRPDVLTMGLNNVGKVVRCKCTVFGDTPACYFPSVLQDFSSIRFARHCYADSPTPWGGRWRDDGSMLFFNHKPGFPAREDLLGDVVVANRNSLAISLFILLSLGVSRIVLCGSSFDSGSYSNGQVLDEKARNWNERLYRTQVQWLHRVAALTRSLGVDLVDTSVRSKVPDVIPSCTLAYALTAYAPLPKADPPQLPHCTQTRVLGEDERRQTEPVPPQPKDATPVFSGLKLGDDGEGDLTTNGSASSYRWMTLLFLDALARSNPGRPLYFMFDEATRDAFAHQAQSVWKEAGGGPLKLVTLSRQTIDDIGAGGRLTFMANARLSLHKFFPGVRTGIWLDTDAIVHEDLSLMTLAAEGNYRHGKLVCGVFDRGIAPWRRAPNNQTYVNSGVLHMNFEGIRACSEDPIDRLKQTMGADNKLYDQDILNSLDHGELDRRWNVLAGMFAYKGLSFEDFPSDDKELFRTAYITHYTGPKPQLGERTDPFAWKFFDLLGELVSRTAAQEAMKESPLPETWRRRLGL